MGAVDSVMKLPKIARAILSGQHLMEIAQLKSENAERVEEVSKLKARVRELEDQLSVREELHFENGVYWAGTRPPGDMSAQPFCNACWDDKGKQNHMNINRGEYIDDYFKCPVCENRVTDAKGTPKRDPNRQKFAETEYDPFSRS